MNFPRLPSTLNSKLNTQGLLQKPASAQVQPRKPRSTLMNTTQVRNHLSDSNRNIVRITTVIIMISTTTRFKFESLYDAFGSPGGCAKVGVVGSFAQSLQGFYKSLECRYLGFECPFISLHALKPKTLHCCMYSSPGLRFLLSPVHSGSACGCAIRAPSCIGHSLGFKV